MCVRVVCCVYLLTDRHLYACIQLPLNPKIDIAKQINRTIKVKFKMYNKSEGGGGARNTQTSLHTKTRTETQQQKQEHTKHK